MVVSVLRDIRFVPFVFGCRFLLGITDNDGVQRYQVAGQCQQLLHSPVTFLKRVEGGPYSTQIEGICHQEEVLCSCRTVLDLELLFRTFKGFV